MKKLLVALIALSLLLTAQTIVLAETETAFSATAVAEYTTSNGLGTYNSDGDINITVSLSEPIIPDTVDGISVFMFSIVYDNTAVTPALSGANDEYGDAFDFTELIVSSPDGWECFGSIDSQSGVFELALWDPDAINHFAEGTLEITVPFKVNHDAVTDPIVFDFSDCQIVDNDLLEYAEAEISSVSVEYALRPDEFVESPLGAIDIEYVGYGDGNSVFYAGSEMTVGEYVALYSDTENGEDKMSDYAIALVDASNGIIVYCDTEIGENSDKSELIIPSGHYLIAVKSDDAYGLEEFLITAETDAKVVVYNLNVKAAGYGENGAFTIEDASFVIIDPIPELINGVNAVYDYESAIIKVYGTKLDLADFKGMFANNVTVLDKNGNELYGGYVKTGMTLDYADGVTIVMMGDVDSDGDITQRDYMLIKRYCFNSFELTGAELLAAHVTGSETVSASDYLVIKRICFNTLDISNFI